jgi:hypothetical protein
VDSRGLSRKNVRFTRRRTWLDPVHPQAGDNCAFFGKFSRARVDKNGVGSIQSTHRRQKQIGGVRQGTVLVIEKKRPRNPDRDVLRKTEILGMGIKSILQEKNLKNRTGSMMAIRRTVGETTGRRREVQDVKK